MSNETTTTVAGNLTADPELRLTPTGRAVARFIVASTTCVPDSTSCEWRDGDPLFLRCTARRRLARNVAESLHNDNCVVVLQQRTYETGDERKHSTIELGADDVSVSLRHAIAQTHILAGPCRGRQAARPDVRTRRDGTRVTETGRTA